VVTFLTPLAWNSQRAKGSIGHALTVRIHTENQNQVSFCPFALRELSVLAKLTLEHCVTFWQMYRPVKLKNKIDSGGIYFSYFCIFVMSWAFVALFRRALFRGCGRRWIRVKWGKVLWGWVRLDLLKSVREWRGWGVIGTAVGWCGGRVGAWGNVEWGHIGLLGVGFGRLRSWGVMCLLGLAWLRGGALFRYWIYRGGG